MALDLKLVLAFILLAVVFIYVPYLNESVARPAVGILMVLFVPGYSLIAALIPGQVRTWAAWNAGRCRSG